YRRVQMTEVNLNIYSPRWGRHETYIVELHKDYMEISMGAVTIKATYSENQDPEWSEETLQDIMNNDSVYPPEITQNLFQHAWLEWRKGALDNDEVTRELELVAQWVNKVTEAKPNSDFWRKYF
ncbi:hypothetical protein ACR0WA_003596, partial [Vibrio cholerae]